MMVLDRETQRVCDAAERVRLVVRAEALRRGVVQPREITGEEIDGFE